MNDSQFNVIYKRVKPWFDSKDEAHQWYTHTIIPSFGCTAEKLVNAKGAEGVNALQEWIVAKELGGFE